MRFLVSRYGLILLLLLILLALLGLWFRPGSYGKAEDIRNVLLISIDTCRADHLSCYGYKSKTTPNIDAVAADGMLFENVIAPIPETLPSHSSMLTGTIPPYHGVHDNAGGYLADESNITLAEILKDAGFVTAAAVSAVVLDSQFGINQGFDYYDDRFQTPLQGEVIEQRQAGETTAVALEWLEENKDKRFFFFLHYCDPHALCKPPQPFASRFASNLYAGEIAYTDQCIGRVLSKLKEFGLYDSTLIIITSDHGEMRGEHGESTHMYFIYQGAMRVPLIIRLPAQTMGARIKSLAGIIDIAPTVCGLLNIEIPEHVQGVNLFATAERENDSARDRHLFCESLYPTKYKANSLLGVVNDRFKYIQTTRPELYDLIADPGETNNLAEEQPQRVRVLKKELVQMIEQSVRKDPTQRKVQVDPETIAKLEALGYVGGPVTEDFSFDQTKDDPKDLLQYHTLNMRIQFHFVLKEYAKVRILAQQMIQQQPDLPFGYEQLGSAALEQKDFSKAIFYFEKAIEITPDNAQTYNNRAIAYGSKGQYDLATRDLNRAIELNPRDIKAYCNRGLAHRANKEYDQAISDINRAIELNPSYAQAFYNRGLVYSSKGEYNLAIRDFEEAVKFAQARGNKQLAKYIQDKIKLYKAKQRLQSPTR